MKREFLEGLGLSKEQIDKIMDQNGQDIEEYKTNANKEKLRADGLQSQLETLTTDLTNARNDASTLRDVQARLDAADAKVKAYQRNESILGALGAFKPRDAKMLAKLLDDEKITIADDGTISGLNEQVEALKASSAYLFADSPDPRGGNPNPGTGGGAFDMNAFLRG